MDDEADEVLMARIAEGQELAFQLLMRRHLQRSLAIARRMSLGAADAEDVVQEVFAQAWRQASRYDARRGAVAAWLLTMARTRAIDRLRARRSRPDQKRVDARPGDVGDIPDTRNLPDVQLVSAEQVARVRAALNELPVLQRVALELAYYEGLTHVEIAERLEQPLGTVKTRIRLAMLKLRDALAGTV